MSSITCVVIIVVFIYIFLYFIWVVRHAIFYVSVEPNTFLVFLFLCIIIIMVVDAAVVLVGMIMMIVYALFPTFSSRVSHYCCICVIFLYFMLIVVSSTVCLRLVYRVVDVVVAAVVQFGGRWVYRTVSSINRCTPPLLGLLLSLVSVSPSRLVRSSIQPTVRLVALELYI